MARGSGRSLWSRLLPALLLPSLVALLHPQGGLESLPLVLVAGAFGLAVSVAVPQLQFSLLASLMLAALLLCVAYVQELSPDDGHERVPHPPAQLHQLSKEAPPSGVQAAEEGGPVARPPRAEGGVARAAAEQISALRWRAQPSPKEASDTLETMSIVLPCAFEGEFAEKTVNAIWDNTRHERIKEILVVDDGSVPPLKTIMSPRILAGGPGVAPMRIIRHEKTKGLIGAKKAGGDAAVGDVIVFLDCHIKPRQGWEEAFFKQMKRAGDHRTVVVPTITSLDPDTWEEIRGGANGKVCYVLWNSDFTWLSNPGRDAPLMSGGLLALSRKWWQETEGYDEHMVAWGGENIDQSIRIWLCGGRIEVADGAYIAHMWRDPKNPKTTLKYPIPTKDVMRNKARATKAWFGPFTEKVFSFPEYESFAKFGEPIGDMSNFDRLREKLQCKPFSHYIHRFSYVYLDSGLVPAEIFQLRDRKTGLCLERVQQPSPPHHVVLLPCGGGEGGGPVPELQWWHRGNRDPSRAGKTCCSGIMNWNFLQCLDATFVGAKLRTFDCEIQGGSVNQHFFLDDETGAGQLRWRHNERRWGGLVGEQGGCLGFTEARLADSHLVPTPGICSSSVESVGTEVLHLRSGDSVPAHFRLRSTEGGGLCASASAASEGPEGANSILGFQRCEEGDSAQILHAKPMLTGLQITVGDSKNCLDSAGGSSILVYPCYEESIGNYNQVWQIKDGHLVWQLGQGRGKNLCADARLLSKHAGPEGRFTLQTCVSKPGQRLRKEDQHSDGTFLVKDADDGRCLIHRTDHTLGLGECSPQHRWRVNDGGVQVEHVASSMCIDAGVNEQNPVLYPCHRPRVSRKQKFQLVEEPGWIQMLGTWGDNGRKRWFEKCLDHKAVDPVQVTVQPCDRTTAVGIAWEKHNSQVPLERRLWNEAEKPPAGALPLGGSAAPP